MSHTQRESLKVLLLGNMAVTALEGLQARVQVPCEFIPVPGKLEDPKALSLIEEADVLVAPGFTKKMGAVAKKLRLVQAPFAGLEAFDLEALPPGVVLANVYNHEVSIAEFVLMAMLVLSKQLKKYDADLRRGFWGHKPFFAEPLVGELQNKILGLIGFGHIGREIAVRARAFSMKIWAIRKHGKEGIQDSKAPQIDFLGGKEDLPQLLSQADFIVLCCPLTEETRGLIGTREFNRMKPTAYLINIARAEIVNEEALYQALWEKKIAGAALDVWYRYPRGYPSTSDEQCFPSRFPFQDLDNVIMTPHISGRAESTLQGRLRDIADNISRVYHGQPLKNVVYVGK
ncbi:MAG TPA: 2-hydroxyacid dehydrogenase [Candidatus Limnocylindrales bacterium]|nr:2-hydroxyacid dehydrogenase [Candidatus Limnocylindrales bacterium]